MKWPKLHVEPIDRNPYRADEIFRKVPELTADKLLEYLAVDMETPLLVGVLHVLRGIEEIAKENASMCKLTAEERAWYAGQIAMAAEAQERIIELVEKGNLRKVEGRR